MAEKYTRQLPESWDTPDEDAQRYTQSFVDFLAHVMANNGRFRRDIVVPDFETLGDQDVDDIWQNNANDSYLSSTMRTRGNSWRTAEASVEFFDSLDCDYEKTGNIDDDFAAVRNLIAEAKHAIARLAVNGIELRNLCNCWLRRRGLCFQARNRRLKAQLPLVRCETLLGWHRPDVTPIQSATT